VHDAPYLTAEGGVGRGTLVTVLELNGEETEPPSDHKVYLAEDLDHPADRTALEPLLIGNQRRALLDGLEVDIEFSRKPADGSSYRDYHHKMTTYVALIASPLREVAPDATARTFPLVTGEEEDDGESIFAYYDTASTRAGIAAITEKLRDVGSVAIVGLGGTGSYLLDFLSKAPVPEIHLFDGDEVRQSNAFRMPGAMPGDRVTERPSKVAYLAELYSSIHTKIVPHAEYVDADNAGALDPISFVFLAIDDGLARKLISIHLEQQDIPFIDVGMGVLEGEELSLFGSLRTTISTSAGREHAARRLPFGDPAENEYDRNIQVVELNAMNAALALIRWKKYVGYYSDLRGELNAIYTTADNHLLSFVP
jgi:hypothetical protein